MTAHESASSGSREGLVASSTGPSPASAGPSTPGGRAADYRAARSELLSRPGSRVARRRALTALTDDWLTDVFSDSGASERGWALAAVGGYGRGDLAPGSDLDILLLTPEDVEHGGPEAADVVDRLWYPVWDSGVRIDHSVRTPAVARRVATQDLRVILGLLDMRLITGNAALCDRLRSSILSDWRGLARTRLSELRDAVEKRRERSGDLAHLLEPDLKESFGGLRDLTIMRAIAASWVTDVPRQGLDDAHVRLLDVRDALHEVAIDAGRRPSDVLVLQDQDDVAARLGVGDADDLLRAVSDAARTVAFASDVTWHRVGRLTRQRSVRPLRRPVRRPGPERVPLAEGVVIHDGEVVLAVDARPDRDPVLVLRLAAAAAQAGLPVGPAAMERLAAESSPLPVPWPRDAREALVSLLGAGPGLVGVWEAMDRAGLVDTLIPGWDVVRSAPQRNPLHVYRVDRHLVETAAAAGSRVRRVDRPDLLLVGALLHDIGKARERDHTEVGMELVANIGPRMGFNEADTNVLVSLVRLHLLLPDTATRRDVDDPATLTQVAHAVGDLRTLELLHALTEADAAATGPAAWSDWKASLVEDLVIKTRALLDGQLVPAPPTIAERFPRLIEAQDVSLIMEGGSTVSTVVVAADDRPGLLGTLAGVLALHRLEVRSADTQTVVRGDGTPRAISVWHVQPLFGEPPSAERLREDARLALAGDLDVGARLDARAATRPTRWPVPPRVDFAIGASAHSDVIEVRAHDEPGLLHRIGMALSRAGAFVTAARVSTLGSEAVDVFYVQNPDGSRLDPADRGAIVAAVMEGLTADR